jgi:hypothetical protein
LTEQFQPLPADKVCPTEATHPLSSSGWRNFVPAEPIAPIPAIAFATFPTFDGFALPLSLLIGGWHPFPIPHGLILAAQQLPGQRMS